MIKDWKEKFKVVPVNVKQDVLDLLTHKVDVIWLHDHRYFIFDHQTQKNFVYSDSNYPEGDDTLYQTPFTYKYVSKNLEKIQSGRAEVIFGEILDCFPNFMNYVKEHGL